jgi:hypothetical protein
MRRASWLGVIGAATMASFYGLKGLLSQRKSRAWAEALRHGDMPVLRQRNRAFMLDQLALLRSRKASQREDACGVLGDFFELSVGGAPGEFQDEIRHAMQALIDIATHDADKAVRTAALSALSAGATYADGAQLADWDSLVAKLDRLDANDLDDAISLLASTGDPKYRAVVASYAEDPREPIRISAREALAELDVQINVASGRRAFAGGLDETQALEQSRADVPVFQASNVLVGYYVRPHEMRDRGGASWQTYRTALNRLDLPDFFDGAAKP